MSIHGASMTTLFPENIVSLPRLKRENSEMLISRNNSTQEPDKPSKKEKVDSSIDKKNH